MFKIISAYPNYSISTEGVIINNKTLKEMKWIDNGKGYKTVKLYNGTRPQGRLCLVHRLVLATWEPTEDSSLDVNHIDGNKSNNSIHNLEWITKSQNTQHAHLTGLFKNKLSLEDVKLIKEIKKRVDRETQAELATQFGVTRSVIGKIWSGDLYGYV